MRIRTWGQTGSTSRRRHGLAALALVATVTVPALVAPSAAALAPTCNNLPITVDLELGDTPTAGDDVIWGTTGDDVIAAMGGNDTICGNGGNDRIWGQGGDDWIFGGDGDDHLRGGTGEDRLFGEDGVDNVAGGPDDDAIWGGKGADAVLRGSTGDDFIRGGEGDDLLIAGNGGEDRLYGDEGHDKLTGGPRPDQIQGNFGHDLIKGHKGADYLRGGAGTDSIFGGPQPDDIDGGPGADICNGGTTGEGAIEDDQAANCLTTTNIEGSNPVSPSGRGPVQILGEVNLGGRIADPHITRVIEHQVIEGTVDHIELLFVGRGAPCLAADAYVTEAGSGAVQVTLETGFPVDLPEMCPASLQHYTLVIPLSEPLDGRLIVFTASTTEP